jgi:hypothetical protein
MILLSKILILMVRVYHYNLFNLTVIVVEEFTETTRKEPDMANRHFIAHLKHFYRLFQ